MVPTSEESIISAYRCLLFIIGNQLLSALKSPDGFDLKR